MLSLPANSTPHYRYDPFSDQWTIVAPEREGRPNEFAARAVRRNQSTCPFCLENEGQTPPSTAQWSLPDSPYAWDVRVVPNKFPAVCPVQLDKPHSNHASPFPRWGEQREAEGVHEVIIESADHRVDWSEFSPAHLALVLQAYRHQLRMAAEAHQLRYGLVFKNVGPAAGASIEHAHSQLLALQEIPPWVTAREARCTQHLEATGRCLTCDWLEWELHEGERIVEANPEFVVVCPWFSRVAGECWIVPRQHTTHFTDSDSDTLASLAESLARWSSYWPCGQERSYNVILQTAPLMEAHAEASHWSIQVLPRRTAVAGFEWATGCTINTLAPETAADAMRSAHSETCRV